MNTCYPVKHFMEKYKVNIDTKMLILSISYQKCFSFIMDLSLYWTTLEKHWVIY